MFAATWAEWAMAAVPALAVGWFLHDLVRHLEQERDER